MPESHCTFCRICEATCGLWVETEANRIVDVRPDPEHVVSRGYACAKGTRCAATQHSPARVTDDLMPLTVAIPQRWGHARSDGLGHARRHPGVSSNLLAGDGPENIEPLSGMSHLSGILIDVRRAPDAPATPTPEEP